MIEQKQMRQDKKNRKEMNTNKGITLIALVITIIVLLILAAVSIATLTGQNGILTQANKAKEQTEIAEAKERAQLDIAAWRADKLAKNESIDLTNDVIKSILTGKDYVGTAGDTSFTTAKNGYEINYSDLYNNATGGSGETPTPPEGVTPGEIVTGGNKEYTNNGTAIIPEGFAIVPGLDDVSQGLVISDVANDIENVGNQFVWVPVPEISDFHTIEGYSNGILQSYLANCSEPYTSGYATEVEEYNRMKTGVENNHGFYIGRYETGKEDNQAVVKKDTTVYNNIKWGNSMTDATGGAVEVAKNFATEKRYTSVTSTLCYGVQWDAALQFMDNNYINGNCDSSSYLVNSTNKGNYSGSIINTGSNDNYAVKNIYDMAGNVLEWTMEACYTDFRVSRGGNYNRSGSDYPASQRGNYVPSVSYAVIGFRVALYL